MQCIEQVVYPIGMARITESPWTRIQPVRVRLWEAKHVKPNETNVGSATGDPRLDSNSPLLRMYERVAFVFEQGHSFHSNTMYHIHSMFEQVARKAKWQLHVLTVAQNFEALMSEIPSSQEVLGGFVYERFWGAFHLYTFGEFVFRNHGDQ